MSHSTGLVAVASDERHRIVDCMQRQGKVRRILPASMGILLAVAVLMLILIGQVVVGGRRVSWKNNHSGATKGRVVEKGKKGLWL